jgi:hypothetical protein
MLLLPDSPPGVLQEAESGERVVAVEPVEFRDEHDMMFVARTSPGLVGRSPVDGVVTQSRCRAGSMVKSGDVVFRVGDVPIVALWTEHPLFRNVKMGMKGEDVQALSAALKELGYDIGSEKQWDSVDMSSYKKFLSERGVDSSVNDVAYADLLPMPAKETKVAACSAHERELIVAGDELLRFSDALESLQIAELEGLAAGKHLVFSGDNSAELSEEGTISDSEFLAAVSAGLQSSQQNSAEGGSLIATVNLNVALAEPVHALAVPPSSLFAVSGGDGCVMTSDGNSIKVHIVSSAMGSTLVSAEKGFSKVFVYPKEYPKC